MMELLKRLYPHRMAPVSEGLDEVSRLLAAELPFKIHEYPSGEEYNGWVVPQKWGVKKAVISSGGKAIYDGAAHPLGVIGYSQSFSGRVPLEELKKHLFYRDAHPDALVYHCDLYYKIGKKDWGFSMPLNKIKALEPGDYDIELETEFSAGTMKVCDYFLPGESAETIILNAHDCHPGQANDDIAGVVVAVEVMRRLAKRKNYYSYRLIVAPEHFGTIFYLRHLPEKVIKTFKFGMFLEMLGSETPFALQESFTGKSDIDRAARLALAERHPDSRTDGFRKIVGNDETVWEAPGYEVPTISLSRFPYPQYHTNMDTDAIISPDRLEESAVTIMDIVDALEDDHRYKRHFTGLVALSNPKYDLYVSPGDPSIPIAVGDEQKRWNHLMNCLPRYFDEKTSVLDVAEKHGLPRRLVYEYIKRFEAKGLVSRVPRKPLAFPPVLKDPASARS